MSDFFNSLCYHDVYESSFAYFCEGLFAPTKASDVDGLLLEARSASTDSKQFGTTIRVRGSLEIQMFHAPVTANGRASKRAAGVFVERPARNKNFFSLALRSRASSAAT